MPHRYLYAAPVALAFLAMLSSSLLAQDVPRPKSGEWVVDQTQTLSTNDKAALNRLCEEVNVRSGAEMVVVMIRTTGGRDYIEFANSLRDRWGVGNAERDDGIMLFIAKDDRKFRIVLGDGVDTPGQVQMVQNIYEREIKPNFRAGKFSEGTYAAAYQCAEQILGLQTLESPNNLGISAVESSPNSSVTVDLNNDDKASSALDNKDFPAEMTQRDIDRATREMNRDLVDRDRLTIPNRRPDRFEAQNDPAQNTNAIGLILLITGGTVAVSGVTLVGGRWLLKNRIRVCNHCQSELAKLNEQQDDEYLEPEERLEESLGSVKYDVWACLSCEDVIKLRYGVFFTRFSNCPQCSRKTKSKISRTVVAATEHRGGVVEVTEKCANCTYHHQYTYRTPRVKRSNSSGGRRSRGGIRFGSGSRSSGGRSSGGRSFGGGSSSGRGGGGGW